MRKRRIEKEDEETVLALRFKKVKIRTKNRGTIMYTRHIVDTVDESSRHVTLENSHSNFYASGQ